MESYLLWQEDVAQSDFDKVTMENNEWFPIEMFVARFAPQARILRLVADCSILGIPISRRRLFVTALSNRSLVWLGPSTDVAIHEDFMSFFARQVVVEGDFFAGLDSETEVQSVRRRMAARRGIYGGPLDDLKSFLTTKGQQYLADYHEMSESRKGMRGSFVCDIGQNPKKRARCSPWLPTATKSSKFVSLTKKDVFPEHIFTPNEMAFAHGWPTIPTCSNMKYRQCMPSHLLNLSINRRGAVLGNGVHLNMLYAWNLYVEAHTVRRDSLEGFVPRLLSEARGHDSDVEFED